MMDSFSKTFTVDATHTAATLGSGSLDVLSTPMLVAWMENTAVALVDGTLSADDTTVGVAMDVRHLKASPVGESVTVTASLVEMDGRRFSFDIVAADSAGNIVGSARHERFLVNSQRFMSKLK